MIVNLTSARHLANLVLYLSVMALNAPTNPASARLQACCQLAPLLLHLLIKKLPLCCMLATEPLHRRTVLPIIHKVMLPHWNPAVQLHGDAPGPCQDPFCSDGKLAPAWAPAGYCCVATLVPQWCARPCRRTASSAPPQGRPVLAPRLLGRVRTQRILQGSLAGSLELSRMSCVLRLPNMEPPSTITLGAAPRGKPSGQRQAA